MNNCTKDISELFYKNDDEFLSFDKIPIEQRRHPAPDICAMIYLYEKLQDKDGNDVDHPTIVAAKDDQIWFRFDNIEQLTEEDTLYLTRCGIHYDEDIDSLAMFI